MTERPRLEVLDGLRFVAAMSVLAYHYTAIAHVWHRSAAEVFPSQPFAHGWLGVQLFFLISGFVICMSSWGRGVGSFLLSRAVRLYPAYWLSVLVVAAGLAVFPGLPWRPTTFDVLVNLTMFEDAVGTPEIADVYWSLWAEVRFYLLFSLLVWWGLTYRRVVAFCALWLAATAVATVVLPGGGAVRGAVQVVLTTDQAPLFTAGIGCYLMYRFRPTFASWAIVAASFVLALPAVMHRNQLESKAGESIPNGPVIVLLAVWFLLIVAVALGWLSWVRGRWLVVGGALTYPLYLLHLDVGGALLYLFQWRVPPPLLVPVVAGVVILLAWLVHRYVERPLAPRLRGALRWLGARARGPVRRG
ncbi:MAG TPA: acyltransferase [Actinophytocola sp.]|uniref:acyltransferase family protein n=1 Tax=Actinophytocola sp. TaxID=1872138 RepID=UPI002F9389BC